jgi:hypothetical protein
MHAIAFAVLFLLNDACFSADGVFAGRPTLSITVLARTDSDKSDLLFIASKVRAELSERKIPIVLKCPSETEANCGQVEIGFLILPRSFVTHLAVRFWMYPARRDQTAHFVQAWNLDSLQAGEASLEARGAVASALAKELALSYLTDNAK